MKALGKMKPDEYFLNGLEMEHANIIALIRDKRLISYIKENPECCECAIEKLKELALMSRKSAIKKNAFKTCTEIGVVSDEFTKEYQKSYQRKRGKKSPSAHKSKIYNPPVGEFGFCCEEEKMAILFSHIRKKNVGDFETFQIQFTNRYSYEASLLDIEDMKRLFQKYYEYSTNGKLAEIQAERRRRINSTLPIDILSKLGKYGLRVTRADGRGTSKQIKKCRRKKQYDADRLSGYRIISIKRGIPIAGKKFELYEDDVREFVDKLESGEISVNEMLEKERE